MDYAPFSMPKVMLTSGRTRYGSEILSEFSTMWKR
jgi:hypothetical protein